VDIKEFVVVIELDGERFDLPVGSAGAGGAGRPAGPDSAEDDEPDQDSATQE